MVFGEQLHTPHSTLHTEKKGDSMKLIEAISKIDNLKHNTYTHEDKVAWLSRLDFMVKQEIMDTHEDNAGAGFVGYDTGTDVETELLVPPPYDEVYLRWLEAQIDYANGEYSKYNNSMEMFNTAYRGYANAYNRTQLAKGCKRKFF